MSPKVDNNQAILDILPSKNQKNTRGIIAFDRDDTIIFDAGQHNDVSEFRLLEQGVELLRTATQSNFMIAIASNQSGIESGKFTVNDLINFNNHLRDVLWTQFNIQIPIIISCPHVINSNCHCRKPKPGLLDYIQDLGMGEVKLFIGNSITDELAASNFGVPFINIGESNSNGTFKNWINSNENL